MKRAWRCYFQAGNPVCRWATQRLLPAFQRIKGQNLRLHDDSACRVTRYDVIGFRIILLVLSL